ncbi:MAG TPA: phosphoribosyltransferase, partial [Gammaproteobacteria bacterium]
LQAILDVAVFRKLAVPGQPHLTMGVIVSGGARYLNKEVINQTRVTRKQFDTVFNSEIMELQRRERLYRVNRELTDISYATVMLVDDGMTSIDTIYSVAMALRAKHPKRIVAALPVAPIDAAVRLGEAVDDFECVYSPADFQSADQYYKSFDEVEEKTAGELYLRVVSGQVAHAR